MRTRRPVLSGQGNSPGPAGPEGPPGPPGDPGPVGSPGPSPAHFLYGFVPRWTSATTIDTRRVGIAVAANDPTLILNVYDYGILITLNTAVIGAGGLQAAAVVNTTYDLYLIWENSFAATARLFGVATGTAIVLPGTWNAYLRIGTFRLNAAGAIQEFVCHGSGSTRTFEMSRANDVARSFAVVPVVGAVVGINVAGAWPYTTCLRCWRFAVRFTALGTQPIITFGTSIGGAAPAIANMSYAFSPAPVPQGHATVELGVEPGGNSFLYYYQSAGAGVTVEIMLISFTDEYADVTLLGP